MKKCRDCLIDKNCDEFYKRSSSSDGLYSYCKICTSIQSKKIYEKYQIKRLQENQRYKLENKEKLCSYSRDYYWKNRDKVLKNTKEYRENNKTKISQRQALSRLQDSDRFKKNRDKHKAWSSKNRDWINEYQRLWYQKNKEKRRAHVILNRALLKGLILRPENCSECKKTCKPDGHHENYSNPLAVIWVCRSCHSRKSPRTVMKCLS